MGLYDSRQWISDLDERLAASPWIGELSGRRVLITGVTGLLCSALTDLLIRWNETEESLPPIEILAAGRSPEKVRSRFGSFAGKAYFTYLPYDAAAASPFAAAASRAPASGNSASQAPGPSGLPEAEYYIHGASNASPALYLREPVETMRTNFGGLMSILEAARQQRGRRVLYVSSSEVYGEKEGTAPYGEHDFGYIELLNPRSSYSMGKRAAETLCASYTSEYGIDTVIVRPGHIYGPTASSADNRVSSAWPRAAARGEDIVMKSDGSQLRSYCHCLDAAAATLLVLLRGETCRAYNISNPASVISIREMAELLADTAGVRLLREMASDDERRGFNPMRNSSVDGTALISLGWQGVFDAGKGFAHTVSVLRESGI